MAPRLPRLLLFGLWNHGSLPTRHSAGAALLAQFVEERQPGLRWLPQYSNRFEVADAGPDCPWIAVRPKCFINESGVWLKEALGRFRCTADDVLIIVDDVDTQIGILTGKSSGGARGHNGMRSIINQLGQPKQLHRALVGIGRPINDHALQGHVLGRFSPTESQRLKDTTLPKLGVYIDDLVDRRRAAAEYDRQMKRTRQDASEPER